MEIRIPVKRIGSNKNDTVIIFEDTLSEPYLKLVIKTDDAKAETLFSGTVAKSYIVRLSKSL